MAFCMLALALAGCVQESVNRGHVALKIGDYERAVLNFNQVLDQQPDHRDARYGLALAYYGAAEQAEHMRAPSHDLWKKAAREFEILSKVDLTGRIDANYSTTLFYLARSTLSINPRANVLSLLDRSIELDSLNYFSLNLKALILSEQGFVEDAKKIFVYIVTKEPKFASAYLNLGNLYWNMGDVESAWDVWSMGSVKLPENRALAHWTQIAEDSLKARVLSGEL
ncbi:MAG: tetratricopeptide repeat protein [Fibrobacter sp.]|nr:tetratricopeptide repeat protein [Fibrobacter sp.]